VRQAPPVAPQLVFVPLIGFRPEGTLVLRKRTDTTANGTRLIVHAAAAAPDRTDVVVEWERTGDPATCPADSMLLTHTNSRPLEHGLSVELPIGASRVSATRMARRAFHASNPSIGAIDEVTFGPLPAGTAAAELRVAEGEREWLAQLAFMSRDANASAVTAEVTHDEVAVRATAVARDRDEVVVEMEVVAPNQIRTVGAPLTSPVRFEIQLPAGALTFMLSPDGRQLAFLAPGPDGRNLVWIRTLDSLQPHPLRGTENVFVPIVWSPDSRFIAFQSGSKLKKIDISGGPPQEVCDAFVAVIGGAWNRDGTIIFGTVGKGIMQVPAAGGVATLLTTTEGRNEVHTFPSFLPDGRHFLYLRAPENPGIYLGSLDVKPEQQSPTRILSTSHMAVYAASTDPRMGRLLFLREGTLLAQEFDERSLQPQGDPIPVAERVGNLYLSGLFSVSPGGVLAYSAGPTTPWHSQLSWFDRQGKKLGDAAPSGTYAFAEFALSPDGMLLATAKMDPKVAQGETGIWLLDLLRGVSARLTFDLSPASAPVWSPDGSRVAFTALRAGGSYGIYQKATNGAGKEQELVRATGDQKFPNDWSRDGRFLLYAQWNPQTHGSDLWILPLAGDGTPSGTATPFANAAFGEDQGRFSPDARWIAYASDESGRSEIYIQPFPAPPNGGSKTPISRDGGIQPHWRRDGKELFYFSLDGKLMAADVTEGKIFKASLPRILFQVPVAQIGHNEGSFQTLGWDVAPDGKRLLIDMATTSSEPVTVVLNWTAEMKNK